MKLERYRENPPASISGTCLHEDWDFQVEEIKNILGADAYIKIHGTLENMYLFTALPMEKK